MDITEFQKVNESRKMRWHKDGDWEYDSWTNAMAGETGEACNITKKMRRLMTDLPNKEDGLDVSNLEELKYKLSKEVADSIIYGLLILSKLGIDASEIIADVYDQKSIEYGFPERAPREKLESFNILMKGEPQVVLYGNEEAIKYMHNLMVQISELRAMRGIVK